MGKSALEGLLLINGKDVWTEYGVFLAEEKEGDRQNQTSLMTPSKVKGHVGVDLRDLPGVKYSEKLQVCNAERDVTLLFALMAPGRDEWLRRYRAFIKMLKEGADGWLTVKVPTLGLEMRMFYVDSGNYKPLTSLWQTGMQVSSFRVILREPKPEL